MLRITHSPVALSLLLLASVRAETGPEVAWLVPEQVRLAARAACEAVAPSQLRSCYADAMQKAGASPQAVAFTRGHTDVVTVTEWHAASAVGIAAVTRPFRANDNNGILLLGHANTEVDVDDLLKLPDQDLKGDADYQELLRANPRAMLLPGDRSSAHAVEVEEFRNGSLRFFVDYRVVDGCRACASLGTAWFGFDFDKKGKPHGIRFIDFVVEDGSGVDRFRNRPAALDMSAAPRLIRLLHDATREHKANRVLPLLQQAKTLATDPAEAKAIRPDGRTALHWTVFGVVGETGVAALSLYEEIAAALLAAGAEVNREDRYQNTALDYLEFSPSRELERLLLEHHGESGYFTGDQQRFAEMVQPAASGKAGRGGVLTADLRPGQSIHVRLRTRVGSYYSWTGDPVEAVVTEPVMSGSRVVLAPGTVIDGTVYSAQPAPNKYMRPRLVLDFANVVHADGTRSPVYTRVAVVDNAREAVRKSEIVGIVQPHASLRTTLALRLAGMVNPAISWAIEGIRTAYGLSLRREIDYAEGTDLLLQVTGPSKLRQLPTWAGWRRIPADPALEGIVRKATLRTTTQAGEVSDLTNLMFLGSAAELEHAFQAAGWANAEHTDILSSAKAFEATVRHSGYDKAPVSLLTLDGRAPDYVFQKGLNTFARRHHIRVWKQPGTYQGREVWVSSGTHDTGIGVDKLTKWFHRIDPRIDRERDKVRRDLLFTGGAAAYVLVDRPGAPRNAQNATGDKLFTDGKMLVLMLSDASVNTAGR